MQLINHLLYYFLYSYIIIFIYKQYKKGFYMDIKKRNGRKVIIELPLDLYKEMRIDTVEKNCTITKWFIRAVIDKLNKKEKYNAEDD